MPATQAKRIVRVTLDLVCYDDLDVEDLNWRELLHLEGDEDVHVSIKDYSDVFQCASLNIGLILNYKILLILNNIMLIENRIFPCAD